MHQFCQKTCQDSLHSSVQHENLRVAFSKMTLMIKLNLNKIGLQI
jgi:hypothetical protein